MTEVTPDNAARRYYMVRRAGSPDAWGNWFQPAVDDVSHYIGNPMYEVIELVPAATVTALEAEVERLREDAYRFRRLAGLLDGFDFRLGRNELMMPATYLDSVEIACEFQPGVGQSVIDAIVDTLTGADPT